MAQNNDGSKKADFGKREAPERAKLKDKQPSLLERLGNLIKRRSGGKVKPKADAARLKTRSK
jgi:hypothetical protein